MIREQISESLKTSLKSGDTVATSTLRLMIAAIKDQDIAHRTSGATECLGDEEIQNLLVTMVRQRKDSITAYQKGNREDLAKREQQEIEIIRRFLPAQMSKIEIKKAVSQVVKEHEATTLKDMGQVMAELRVRYRHEMDFAHAGALVRATLSLLRRP